MSSVRPLGLTSTLDTVPVWAGKAGPRGRQLRAGERADSAVAAFDDEYAPVAREAGRGEVAVIGAQAGEESAGTGVEHVDASGCGRDGYA